MERGPMALFGAIVAIGLGPAMWLGVQFGQVTSAPDRPPAVISEQQPLDAPRGGSGAGDAPTDAEVIRSEPLSNSEPLTRTRNARPMTESPSASPSASTDPTTTPPVQPGTSEPQEDETEPPTEPSLPPVEPPDDEDDDPVVPQQPPTVPQSEPATGETAQT